MTDLGEINERRRRKRRRGAAEKPLAAIWLTFPEESATDRQTDGAAPFSNINDMIYY